MKKLFLLIPALILSMMMSATIHEIGPGNPETVVNDLLVAKLQSSAVVDGDVIELKDGIYSEYSNYLYFDKSVEVRAAEGAHPIVEVECYIKIGENAPGKNITIRGIKFDASKQDATGNQSNSYSHFIRVYSAGTLDFENCEFYGCTNQVIEVESSKSVENLIVNNCYFRDITNTCIYVQNTAESNMTITNSTFANIDATGVSAGIIDTKAATGTVVVDHCTFYDCKAKNTDYGVIGHNGSFTSDFTVSNSIFAWATMYDKRATYLPTGTSVSNCLTYNTNKDTDKWGHHSGPTFSNCMLQDPLFNDLAHNKYTYDGIYGVSMSPARGAATDGSDLGDPRWYTNVTYPETDFAAPGYAFKATKAQYSGSIIYEEGGPNTPYLRYNGAQYPGVAEWTIKATRACYVTVTVFTAVNDWTEASGYGNSGHNFDVAIYKDNVRIDSIAEGVYEPSPWDGYRVYPTVDLGRLLISEAGVYTVKLKNKRDFSRCGVDSVTFTYDEDVPITDFAAPGYTCLAKSATLVGNIEYNTTTATPYIRFTDNSDPGTASWNVTATRACQIKVAMNMVDNSAYSSGNGKHRFIVELLKGNEVKSYVEEPSEVDEAGRTFPRSYDMPGYITIPEAGDYTIRLRNPRSHSRCGLASITLIYTYEGGKVVNIPNNAIPFEDALLNNGATRDLESNPQEIHFGSVDAYAEWNIHATDGVYSFTYTVVGSDYGKYNLIIKDAQSNIIYNDHKGLQNSGSVTHSNILLVAGDYTMQVANVNSGSQGYITNIAATAAEGYLILNDNKTDDGSIAAADYDETTHDVKYNILIKRSFEAGRYYTFCVPFDLSDGWLKTQFGAEYELWRMESAEQNDDVINLNFEKLVYDGANYNFEPGAGIPFLLKPSVTVENPVINDKKVRNYTYNNVKHFTAADFVGTFYKDEIPAGVNNLYLQNNNLYYSESNNTPIKGTRAWIRLNQSSSAPARARIVLGEQVATDINLVNGELVNGTVKTIENGQVIIIRDGIRYNVMGAKIQ